MDRRYIQRRLKVRCRKVFLSCSFGLCVLSLLHYYNIVQLRLRVRAVPMPSPLLRIFLRGKQGRPFPSPDQQTGRQWVWEEHPQVTSAARRPDNEPDDQLPDLIRSGGSELDLFPLPDPTGPQWELHKRSFVLRDDSTPYFVHDPLCFRYGIEESGGHPPLALSPPVGVLPMVLSQSEEGEPPVRTRMSRCVCRPGWHGPHCGTPTIVQHSNLATKVHLRPRRIPRRIINAININHEFDLLHARFHELASAVDLFLVCESNFTTYGKPKEPLFLHLLLNGTFDYISHKILYVFLDHFPPGGQQDGWIADDYLRTFLTHNGMSRVQGQRHDDVFIINDADEIPSGDGVHFLKLFDGWTEPFGFHLRKSLYGFYWKQPGTLDVLSGCTLAMLSAVYNGDGILLRRRHYYSLPGFRLYEKSSGRILVPWSLGSPVHYAGWHCSWCSRPEGIYHKMVSAQNGDFPRWGDFEEKRNLNYIKELVRTGGWFDGSVGKYAPTHPRDHMFAPSYLLQNFHLYSYLLENPYAKVEGRKSTV